MPRLCIDSHLTEGGALQATWLVEQDGELWLELDGQSTPFPLPARAVIAALVRYGRPLDEAAPPLDPNAIHLVLDATTRASVCLYAYRAPVDVEPNDYLVLSRLAHGTSSAEDATPEPLAAPARFASAALRALAKAVAAGK